LQFRRERDCANKHRHKPGRKTPLRKVLLIGRQKGNVLGLMKDRAASDGLARQAATPLSSSDCSQQSCEFPAHVLFSPNVSLRSILLPGDELQTRSVLSFVIFSTMVGAVEIVRILLKHSGIKSIVKPAGE
jgi:hypothetical protein